MSKELTPEKKIIYQELVNWTAIPEDKRNPPNIQMYMAQKNLSTDLILELRNHDDFDKDVLAATIEWAKGQTPKLLHAVHEKIMSKKSTQDLVTWVKLVYEVNDKSKNKVKDIINFDEVLTDDRKKEIVQRLARKLGI